MLLNIIFPQFPRKWIFNKKKNEEGLLRVQNSSMVYIETVIVFFTFVSLITLLVIYTAYHCLHFGMSPALNIEQSLYDSLWNITQIYNQKLVLPLIIYSAGYAFHYKELLSDEYFVGDKSYIADTKTPAEESALKLVVLIFLLLCVLVKISEMSESFFDYFVDIFTSNYNSLVLSVVTISYLTLSIALVLLLLLNAIWKLIFKYKFLQKKKLIS